MMLDHVSNFYPEPGKVTACRGVKNVYGFGRGLAEAYITVVLTFLASGVLC
jgi:hypothetical protein